MSEAQTRTKPASARGDVERIELDPAQQSAARAVAESKATAPHAYFGAEVEISAAERTAAKLDAGLTDVIVRAAGLALREVPWVNGAYRDGGVELYSRANVAFPVDTGQTLTFAVIHDADAKEVAAIAPEARQLEAKVRDGSITRPELAGATFTITGFPTHGALEHTPALARGQAATLGFGRAFDAPVIDPDAAQLRPGRILRMRLACDARILQRDEGAAFLDALTARLLAADGL